MSLDEPVAYRQPQPGAAAGVRGKKWIKDAGLVFRRDADSIIPDPDLHTIVRDVAGLDPDSTARLHRVGGIHHQVDQHLLQIEHVGKHRAAGFELSIDDNRFLVEQVFDQRQDVGHHSIRVHRLGRPG